MSSEGKESEDLIASLTGNHEAIAMRIQTAGKPRRVVDELETSEAVKEGGRGPRGMFPFIPRGTQLTQLPT